MLRVRSQFLYFAARQQRKIVLIPDARLPVKARRRGTDRQAFILRATGRRAGGAARRKRDVARSAMRVRYAAWAVLELCQACRLAAPDISPALFILRARHAACLY